MSPEKIVVTEVSNYFSAPKYNRLSVKTEYPVQMGSENRRADVVLINQDEDLVAIIECKKLGYQGKGIDQLQSYLSATNTPLGVFANSGESDSWTFIKNEGPNRFREIALGEFEKRVFKRSIMKRIKRFFSMGRAEKEDDTGSLPVNNGGDSDGVADLNGSPYYSEKNGFSWAKNHRGLPECVPPHIEIIISRTKEEEESTLYDEKNALEVQKHDCDSKIEQQSQKLSKIKKDLAGLEIQLEAPTETELSPPPDPIYDALKQSYKEEINQLRKEKASTEEEIEQKSQEFDQNKEDLARLDVELESPTEAELKREGGGGGGGYKRVHGFKVFSHFVLR